MIDVRKECLKILINITHHLINLTAMKKHNYLILLCSVKQVTFLAQCSTISIEVFQNLVDISKGLSNIFNNEINCAEDGGL
jgi:hypothetical protein